MLIPDSKEAGFDVVCKPARACVCMCFVCACGNVHLCVLYVCVHIEMSISGVFPSLFTLVFATETLLERGIHQFSQPACLKDLSASASLAQELLLAQSPSFVRGHWVQKLDPHVFFFVPSILPAQNLLHLVLAFHSPLCLWRRAWDSASLAQFLNPGRGHGGKPSNLLIVSAQASPKRTPLASPTVGLL